MNTQSIVVELRQELNRINRAIAALEGSDQTGAGRGRPPKASQPIHAGRRGPRTMSAAARARIGAAKKAWWAKQKGQAGEKPTGTAQKKTRLGMSAAARKKLSALMKARWAARKKTA